MIVIGLTGGIASGKSTVADLLRARGAHIIDADKVGHRVLEPNSPSYDQVVATFGDGVVNEDGTINRRALGAIVFADPAELAKLNAISHPRLRFLVQEELDALRSSGRSEPVVVDAALLYEGRWDDFCDVVWTVYVPVEMAIARLNSRNGLTEEQARERLAAQMSPEEKVARANDVIVNTKDLAALEARVDELWNAVQGAPVAEGAG